jgi:diaminohydroxyphosphoribosylaminopyrimidine deaminase/5-amino-6-(5-phosphoribosylamino)uracil reductase
MAEGIRDVRVSIPDPNPDIAGRGVALLQERGVKTTIGILEQEGHHMIRSFTTNMLEKRPHVVLKWAQSKFGYVGLPDSRVLLSENATRMYTHRLRHEADVILVGARTVSVDDPSLTVRDYPGRSPHRAIYDPEGRLGSHYNVFNDDGRSVYYFSKNRNGQLQEEHVRQIKLTEGTSHAAQILKALFADHAGNVLIEGGSYLHSLFIAEKVWDEARVIQTQHALGKGIKAPVVRGELMTKMKLGNDTVVAIRPGKLG